MIRNEKSWATDFPLREEVEDCAGNLRSFVISCHQTELGFTVRAEEEARKGIGYEFMAYSETSPYSALSRVRQKLYRGLATRHISGQPGEYRMLHDRLSGRITSDAEGGLILVVDGIALDIIDLAFCLESHEGWGFELRIVDALE